MKTVSAVKRKERKTFPDKERIFWTPLRSMRLNSGLTFSELSEHTGLNQSTLCRAEAGLTIELVTALKIARFFEKPVEEIWQPARANGKGKGKGK